MACASWFLGHDLRDFERGEGLTMALLSAVVLAAAHAEDDDLRAEALRHDLGFDLRPAEERLAELQALAALAVHEEDRIEGHALTHGARELLDAEAVARSHPVLLSARLEYCVHDWSQPSWEMPRPAAGPGRARRNSGGVLGGGEYTGARGFVK